MRRCFLLFALFVGGLYYGWVWAFNKDGVLHFLDTHRRWRKDWAYYGLAYTYATLNHQSKAEELYSRVVNNFPNSRYREDSLYQEAFSIDQRAGRNKAREKYQQYLKDYPHGRYANTVSNAVD